MSPSFTITSLAPGSFAPPTPPPSQVPAELKRRLAESFGGWPQPWAIWQDQPFQPWGYPMGGAPFARGASGTVNDRRGGRDLPLFWNEVDLRGFRVLSRFLCETNSFAIGFLNRLIDYHIRKGFAWQACRKGVKKTPYPTTATSTDKLVIKGQSILDQWRDANNWPSKSREGFKRWCRDGEVFGRLFFGGRGRLPPFRFVEPEQVGSPDGATDGPYSFGIETDPNDSLTRWAYHVWDMDGGQSTGEWVDAEKIVHLTANVDSTIKRGLPDFFPVQEQLDGVRRLLRNIIETSVTQSAMAWIEKYPTATRDQIRSLIGQIPDERQQNGVNGYPFGAGPYGQQWGGNNLDPSTVLRVEGNREFEPGPTAPGIPNYIQAEQAVLRGASARWGMPEYFSGDSSSGTYNNSLVAGSTFDLAIEGGQLLFGDGFERQVALRVFDLCVEAGLLTNEERDQLDVETTAPAVATNEPEKETTRRQQLNQAGVLSKTTWQLQENLDPQHEAENFKAEAQATAQQQQPQPGMSGDPNNPPADPNAPPDGGGGGFFGESRFFEGFSGTVRGKNGAEYHYVDGKRVAHDDHAGKEKAKSATGSGFSTLNRLPDAQVWRLGAQVAGRIVNTLKGTTGKKLKLVDGYDRITQDIEHGYQGVKNQFERRAAILRADVGKRWGEDALDSPEWGKIETLIDTTAEELGDSFGHMKDQAMKSLFATRDGDEMMAKSYRNEVAAIADSVEKTGRMFMSRLGELFGEFKAANPEQTAKESVDSWDARDYFGSERVTEEHGSPPFQGAVFNTTSHRWEKPGQDAIANRPTDTSAVVPVNPVYRDEMAAKPKSEWTENDVSRMAAPVTDGEINMCFENARKEYQALKAQGKNPTYVVGKLTAYISGAPEGSAPVSIDHAWVEVGGKIVDPSPYRQDKGDIGAWLNSKRVMEPAANHWSHALYVPEVYAKGEALDKPLTDFPSGTPAERVEAAISKRTESRAAESHGPPPYPGAVFNDTSHRWEVPDKGNAPAKPTEDYESEKNKLAVKHKAEEARAKGVHTATAKKLAAGRVDAEQDQIDRHEREQANPGNESADAMEKRQDKEIDALRAEWNTKDARNNAAFKAVIDRHSDEDDELEKQHEAAAEDEDEDEDEDVATHSQAAALFSDPSKLTLDNVDQLADFLKSMDESQLAAFKAALTPKPAEAPAKKTATKEEPTSTPAMAEFEQSIRAQIEDDKKPNGRTEADRAAEIQPLLDKIRAELKPEEIRDLARKVTGEKRGKNVDDWLNQIRADMTAVTRLVQSQNI